MDSASLARLADALADRYELGDLIGRGGMASVIRARDTKHGRTVAVKVLDPEIGASLGAERFLSEIRVTAGLQHPHLLHFFDDWLPLRDYPPYRQLITPVDSLVP